MTQLQPDDLVIVNDKGDLSMDADLRGLVGKAGSVVRQLKSGLYLVVFDTKQVSLPRRNLTAVPRCHFEEQIPVRRPIAPGH